MAAWGQGDPRWIVDDLGDGGKNVNGWHWQEKNKARRMSCGQQPAGGGVR